MVLGEGVTRSQNFKAGCFDCPGSIVWVNVSITRERRISRKIIVGSSANHLACRVSLSKVKSMIVRARIGLESGRNYGQSKQATISFQLISLSPPPLRTRNPTQPPPSKSKCPLDCRNPHTICHSRRTCQKSLPTSLESVIDSRWTMVKCRSAWIPMLL